MSRPKLKVGTFRMIPDRACRDVALTATDFRVLAAIAFYDRGGSNGRGCYATQQTIAKLAGCHRVEASRSISKLRKRGHIRSEIAGGKDARRRTLHVVYEGPDPEENCNNPDTDYVANPLQKNTEMCNSDFEEVSEKQEVTGHKDILLNAREGYAVKQKGYPVETASNHGSTSNWSGEKILGLEEDHTFLAVLDRELGQGRLFGDDVAERIYDRLTTIHDTYDDFEDPIGGRAYRLLETEIRQSYFEGQAHG